MTQINKTRQLRRDLKIVEPSYTSASRQLKSRITSERCLRTINDGGGQSISHRATKNVFVHAPRLGGNREQVFDQAHVAERVSYFERQACRARIVTFEQRRPHFRLQRGESCRPPRRNLLFFYPFNSCPQRPHNSGWKRGLRLVHQR